MPTISAIIRYANNGLVEYDCESDALPTLRYIWWMQTLSSHQKLHGHVPFPHKTSLAEPAIHFLLPIPDPNPRSTASSRDTIHLGTASVQFDGIEFLFELLVLHVQMINTLCKRIHPLFSAGTEFLDDLVIWRSDFNRRSPVSILR